MWSVNWNRLCSQTVGIGHCNLGIKNSVTCCCHCCHVFLFRNIYMWSRPRRLGLGLGVLASFTITGINPCSALDSRPELASFKVQQCHEQNIGYCLLTEFSSSRMFGRRGRGVYRCRRFQQDGGRAHRHERLREIHRFSPGCRDGQRSSGNISLLYTNNRASPLRRLTVTYSELFFAPRFNLIESQEKE